MEKVLIVTGGGRGIGAATARLAARQGYAVCVSYLENRLAAESVVHSIEVDGGRAVAVAADVARESDVSRLFETSDALLGPLSGLVNNAGILEQQMRVDEMDAARLERVLKTNVIGAFSCARHAVKRLSTRYGGLGGAIVNLSSAAARLGAPGEYVDYAASKGPSILSPSGSRARWRRRGSASTPCGQASSTLTCTRGVVSPSAWTVSKLCADEAGGHRQEVARAIVWLLFGRSVLHDR